MRSRHLWVVWFVLLAFWQPRNADAYADRTFDVVVRAYCAPTAQFCGYTSEQAMQDDIRQTLRTASMVWEPTGVSFRFKELIRTVDATVAALQYSSDVDNPGTTDGAQVKALRDLAMADPGVITIFYLPLLDVCWSIVAGYNTPKYPSEMYGVFCAPRASGEIIAHELGHHFCLPHTFTFQDPAQSGFAGHDGDGFADTPPDPGVKETNASAPGADIDSGGAILNGHDWCDVMAHAADPGSPHANYCTATCKRKTAGTVGTAPDQANPALLMSYYKCEGPYVVGGKRTEAFSPQEMARIGQCLAEEPERIDYVNVCPTGEFDNDGVCPFDSCPNDKNLGVDSDGDGVDNACDHCDFAADPANLDSDGDGFGDVCDADIDNDGCPNGTDDDPNSPVQVVGVFLTPNCDVPSKKMWAFAGADSDGDNKLNCDVAEIDDDGDGTPDAADPCPTVVGTDPMLCREISAGCPLTPIDDQCMFGCGVELTLRVSAITNPSNPVVFPTFAKFNDTLFVGRPPGMTTSQVAYILSGELFAENRSFDGQMMFEFVTTLDGQVVAAYSVDAASVARTGSESVGNFVAALMNGSGGWDLEGAYSLSVRLEENLYDTDFDGVPDPADNCMFQRNREQQDRDQDGFGDGCDPDFDNDLIVSADEVARVRGCVGVELRPALLFGEPGLETLSPDVAPLADRIRALECAETDLDGDGQVTAVDEQIADTLAGSPPGPSGGEFAGGPDAPGEDMGTPPDMGGGRDLGAEDAGGRPDAGPTADLGGSDLGVGEDVATGVTAQPRDGGCSCSSAASGASAIWPVLLLGGLLRVRRARRSR